MVGAIRSDPLCERSGDEPFLFGLYWHFNAKFADHGVLRSHVHHVRVNARSTPAARSRFSLFNNRNELKMLWHDAAQRTARQAQ